MSIGVADDELEDCVIDATGIDGRRYIAGKCIKEPPVSVGYKFDPENPERLIEYELPKSQTEILNELLIQLIATMQTYAESNFAIVQAMSESGDVPPGQDEYL